MKKVNLSILILSILFITNCSKEINYFPENIHNLQLVKLVEGEEAKNFVDKLHFQDVATNKNQIGFYKNDGDDALIYISFYDSEDEALEDEKKMTEKISPENSIFIAGKYIDFNGRKIYRTFGMGQAHYVFSHENALIWVSVNTHYADEFLTDYFNKIES